MPTIDNIEFFCGKTGRLSWAVTADGLIEIGTHYSGSRFSTLSVNYARLVNRDVVSIDTINSRLVQLYKTVRYPRKSQVEAVFNCSLFSYKLHIHTNYQSLLVTSFDNAFSLHEHKPIALPKNLNSADIRARLDSLFILNPTPNYEELLLCFPEQNDIDVGWSIKRKDEYTLLEVDTLSNKRRFGIHQFFKPTHLPPSLNDALIVSRLETLFSQNEHVSSKQIEQAFPESQTLSRSSSYK